VIRSWSQRTFESLHNREYRVLWIGSLAAMLAFTMSMPVQAVVAFDIAGTNSAVGVVSLGSGLAMLVLGPFGGVLADRLSKRAVLLVTQGAIGVLYAALGVLVLTDRITLAALVAGTFVMGLGFTMLGPARQAYVAELVPLRQLANAIALSQLSQTFARVVAPMAAGVLIGIAVIGAGGTFLVMAALFVFVIASLRALPPTRARVGGGSMLGDLRAGLRHIVANRRRALLAALFPATVMAGFSFHTVLPGLLEHQLGEPSRMMGPLIGISALGGFVASLALAGVGGGARAWTMMFGGIVLLGGSLLLVAASPSLVTAMGAMVLVGAGSGAFQLTNNSLLMLETEPAFHGRVMSLTTLAWALNGVVALPVGVLADALGERALIAGQGALVLAIAAVGAALHARREREPAPERAVADAPAPGGG